jgi:hypothetical protein
MIADRALGFIMGALVVLGWSLLALSTSPKVSVFFMRFSFSVVDLLLEVL